MKKYWYVAQNTEGVYLIGFCYRRGDVEEGILIESMHEYCKDYRLVLLAHIVPGLPIVNQIYPYRSTEESQYCLNQVLNVAE